MRPTLGPTTPVVDQPNAPTGATRGTAVSTRRTHVPCHARASGCCDTACTRDGDLTVWLRDTTGSSLWSKSLRPQRR
ncbi:hypothetical protein [Saccharothrix algeriensis]|uniref:Uncharacterized protein n=1 Tax=Saccharothrix algeriensis TaxID=173560 RepID=A0ABS2S5J7_9PSEU|nr:hypothetical protein [Saccharothrix algeriensis]MBM7810974.1 hypothetical protein [Saccharothrix algeriensis]